MKKLFICIAFCIFYTIINAQSNSYYGQSLTPRGDLHVLIVFVGFDTTTSANNLPTWDHDNIPDWAMGDYNDVIDIDDNQIGIKRNMTDYFYTMSQGNFIVTGEVYPDLVISLAVGVLTDRNINSFYFPQSSHSLKK